MLDHSTKKSLRNPYRVIAAHLVCFHLIVYQHFFRVTFAIEGDLLPFEERWARLITQVAASSNEMCKRLQATRLTKNDNVIMRGNSISDFLSLIRHHGEQQYPIILSSPFPTMIRYLV